MPAETQHHEGEAVGVVMADATIANEGGKGEAVLHLHAPFS